MLKPTKVPAALYAIHLVLIKARLLAGEGADPKTLYQMLDWAEVLPTLITCREEDTTEEFRETLAGLGEAFPQCRGFLDNFDRNLSWQGNVPEATPP
jgi:hypothetical protein